MTNFVASGHFNVTDVSHVKPDCNESRYRIFQFEINKFQFT
jgi:hypothetical protein